MNRRSACEDRCLAEIDAQMELLDRRLAHRAACLARLPDLVDDDVTLTREDVTELFGISLLYLDAAAAIGRGPHFTSHGDAAAYRPADVRDWIIATRNQTHHRRRKW